MSQVTLDVSKSKPMQCSGRSEIGGRCLLQNFYQYLFVLLNFLQIDHLPHGHPRHVSKTSFFLLLGGGFVQMCLVVVHLNVSSLIWTISVLFYFSFPYPRRPSCKVTQVRTKMCRFLWVKQIWVSQLEENKNVSPSLSQLCTDVVCS